MDTEQRRIEFIDRDQTPATRQLIARSYPTDTEDLWNALTDPERLPRWFLPVTGELRVGGRYQLDGNAGGEVLSCDPPHRFGITWEFDGNVSWVEVSLTAQQPGVTRLELRHEAPVVPEFWEQFGPGATGIGWDLALHSGLREHLTTGEAVDPSVALSWPGTPQGRAFITESATAWAEAAIAAGDDPTAAHAAATRCIAFYTGSDETGSDETGPDRGHDRR